MGGKVKSNKKDAGKSTCQNVVTNYTIITNNNVIPFRFPWIRGAGKVVNPNPKNRTEVINGR